MEPVVVKIWTILGSFYPVTFSNIVKITSNFWSKHTWKNCCNWAIPRQKFRKRRVSAQFKFLFLDAWHFVKERIFWKFRQCLSQIYLLKMTTILRVVKTWHGQMPNRWPQLGAQYQTCRRPNVLGPPAQSPHVTKVSSYFI